MKYCEKDIKELRKIVAEKLMRVPDGKRIKIEKDILEQLLFDVVLVHRNDYFYKTLESYKDEGIKTVAWSGPFLSKVDLSEIDFDYVLWGYFGTADEKFFYPGYKEDKIIDLSNTNAKIDFSLSARIIYDSYNAIMNCNFEGVDLSNNTLNLSDVLLNSNFKNTNIKVESNGLMGVCENCNFDSCNFTNVNVNEYAFGNDAEGFGTFTNLKNTGLKINTSDEPTEDEKECIEIMKISMSLGNLDGCYLNGVLITPNNRKMSTYRSFLDDIDAQIGAYNLLPKRLFFAP